MNPILPVLPLLASDPFSLANLQPLPNEDFIITSTSQRLTSSSIIIILGYSLIIIHHLGQYLSSKGEIGKNRIKKLRNLCCRADIIPRSKKRATTSRLEKLGKLLRNREAKARNQAFIRFQYGPMFDQPNVREIDK